MTRRGYNAVYRIEGRLSLISREGEIDMGKIQQILSFRDSLTFNQDMPLSSDSLSVFSLDGHK